MSLQVNGRRECKMTPTGPVRMANPTIISNALVESEPRLMEKQQWTPKSPRSLIKRVKLADWWNNDTATAALEIFVQRGLTINDRGGDAR